MQTIVRKELISASEFKALDRKDVKSVQYKPRPLGQGFGGFEVEYTIPKIKTNQSSFANNV
jgi:hypothetical protein